MALLHKGKHEITIETEPEAFKGLIGILRGFIGIEMKKYYINVSESQSKALLLREAVKYGIGDWEDITHRFDVLIQCHRSYQTSYDHMLEYIRRNGYVFDGKI